MNFFDIISTVIILAISIWLHEYAHAYVSRKLWDPTPKIQWRLTPNPLAHLDVFGFLLIFIINFWRWKPVQINPAYYKNPVRWELIVALAWPFTNIFLALFSIIIVQVYSLVIWVSNIDLVSSFVNDVVIIFWMKFAFMNIGLAVFNMIPLPPLDGFRIVQTFLPRIASVIMRNSQLISMLFLFILIIPKNQLGSLVRNWIVAVSQNIFYWIMWLVSNIF